MTPSLRSRAADFRVLTFDCYGTLIDWESGILTALRPVLAAHGISATDDHVLEAYGRVESAIQSERFLPYREVLVEAVRRLGNEFAFAPNADEQQALVSSIGDWPPFPDTVDALRALAARYRLAVISNVDDDLFALTVRRLEAGGEPLFSDVITAQQARSYKPSRANFELALRRLAVAKQEILHVAQSLFHDIAPARELGWATVWVNRRGARPGAGATPPIEVRPKWEVPDLAMLARQLLR